MAVEANHTDFADWRC